MKSLAYIPASDGSANASLMTVQSTRSPGATSIITNTIAGVPPKFYATMGTPHTFTDPVTGETITVISEATAVDFAGHVDSGHLEIDVISPGYTDLGSQAGDIVILRPVTEWSNNLYNFLKEAHNDGGTVKPSGISTNAASGVVGMLGARKFYTYNGTNILINGVSQANGSNSIDYTKPSDLKYVIVQVVGGGGAGGGAPATTSGQRSLGNGGNSGVLAQSIIDAGSLASSVTVTVGAGGVGVSGSDGGAGGQSSFGTAVVAPGGAGGIAAAFTSATLVLTTPFATTGGTGTLLIPGRPGSPAYIFSDTSNSGKGGDGGVSPFGTPAMGARTNSAVVENASGYGAGGGGMSNSSSRSASTGSNGSGGLVIIEEYY